MIGKVEKLLGKPAKFKAAKRLIDIYKLNKILYGNLEYYMRSYFTIDKPIFLELLFLPI